MEEHVFFMLKIVSSSSSILEHGPPNRLHTTRTGRYPPRWPSVDWWMQTVAAGTNGLTCLGTRHNKMLVTHSIADLCESGLNFVIAERSEHRIELLKTYENKITYYNLYYGVLKAILF
jgi:hypothetical protein